MKMLILPLLAAANILFGNTVCHQAQELAVAESQSEVFSLLQEISTNHYVLRVGEDREHRPMFVGAQAYFEQAFARMLASGDLVKVIGVIHTPAPATPFCSTGEITENLVDPEILADPARLWTVTKRPDVVRVLLAGGADLYASFPPGGRDLRSEEQLSVFDQLQESYPDHLFSKEMGVQKIPDGLIGATYLLRTKEGEILFFNLLSYQANAPQNNVWGIWFGSLDHFNILGRSNQIFTFLKDDCGIDLMGQIQ